MRPRTASGDEGEQAHREANVQQQRGAMHHGIVLVGLPYTEPQLSSTSTGGTPYGASHHAGAGSAPKPPSSDELALAEALGRRVASIAVRLAA